MLLILLVELLVFKILLPLSRELENVILSLNIKEFFWIGARKILRTSVLTLETWSRIFNGKVFKIKF